MGLHRRTQLRGELSSSTKAARDHRRGLDGLATSCKRKGAWEQVHKSSLLGKRTKEISADGETNYIYDQEKFAYLARKESRDMESA